MPRTLSSSRQMAQFECVGAVFREGLGRMQNSKWRIYEPLSDTDNRNSWSGVLLSSESRAYAPFWIYTSLYSAGGVSYLGWSTWGTWGIGQISLSIRLPLDCESRLLNGTLLKAQRGFKLVTYRAAARQRGKFRRKFRAVRLACRAVRKKRQLSEARKIRSHLRLISANEKSTGLSPVNPIGTPMRSAISYQNVVGITLVIWFAPGRCRLHEDHERPKDRHDKTAIIALGREQRRQVLISQKRTA